MSAYEPYTVVEITKSGRGDDGCYIPTGLFMLSPPQQFNGREWRYWGECIARSDADGFTDPTELPPHVVKAIPPVDPDPIA